MNVFDYLDSNKKSLSDDEKKDFIKIVADKYLSGVRHFDGGIETIMNHEIKRRQLLFFLYGVIDSALQFFERKQLNKLANRDKIIKENEMIHKYFVENLGYKIEEVLDTAIVCSEISFPDEKLGYRREDMFNLVIGGGKSFVDYVEKIREWINSTEDEDEKEYYKNSDASGALLGLLHNDD